MAESGLAITGFDDFRQPIARHCGKMRGAGLSKAVCVVHPMLAAVACFCASSEMHNKVLRRCCAFARRERFCKALKAPTNSVPYYLYCLRLRALYHFILHSTIVSILKNNFKVYGRCDVIGIDWVSHRRNPTQSKWLDKINRLKNRCWVTALAA